MVRSNIDFGCSCVGAAVAIDSPEILTNRAILRHTNEAGKKMGLFFISF
jgi:hypothetical protein